MELGYILCIISLSAYFVLGIYVLWGRNIIERFKDIKDTFFKVKTAKIVPCATITTRAVDTMAVEVIVVEAYPVKIAFGTRA
jgi:hypothetical protein